MNGNKQEIERLFRSIEKENRKIMSDQEEIMRAIEVMQRLGMDTRSLMEKQQQKKLALEHFQKETERVKRELGLDE